MGSSVGERLTARTIGEAWLAVAHRIDEAGCRSTYEGLAVRELLMVTLEVAEPTSSDSIIRALGDPQRLAWMHANFTVRARVPALGDADSYATRLHDYAREGLDQVAWVTERLRRDPRCRSATITTLQPLTDTDYIPCVSLLDFFLEEGALHLVAYCHSIDFGAKGYANLVELAAILESIAKELDVPTGPLVMIVKSAHVYESDAAYAAAVLGDRPR